MMGDEGCSDEPKLKYHRMGNGVVDVLAKDAISCIAVHTKFVCVGSSWGNVYVLDHDGNVVSVQRPHAIAVNHISVDPNGDHIATCSDDGKVSIRGLHSDDPNDYAMSLGRTIKTVALDPQYSRTSRFLVGDNRLTLYERGFFNRINSTTLCECEGYVRALSWHDRFVAWAGDVGVRVYDVLSRCSLGLIRWDNTQSCRCNFVWSTGERDRTLLIVGWVDTVRICEVRKRTPAELKANTAQHHIEYLVDPVHTFQTDYFICGLAPIDSQLVILGYPKDDSREDGTMPTLNISDYKSGQVFEISSDSLNVRAHEQHRCDSYHLARVADENRFFVVSPKDIVVASQYDIDDRVQWAVERGLYERAMDILEKEGGRTSKHSVSSVGIFHMDRLIETGDLEQAASLFSKVCKFDRALWEREVHKFAKINALRFVCPFVPTAVERKLPAHIYESILYEHMKFHPRGFLRLLKDWDPCLYKTNSIICAVIQHMLVTDDADKSVYLEACGVLYCHEKRYDKALSTYLKLQHEDVFKLIKRHNLYNFIHDKILTLMKLDCDKTIALLADKTRVPVEVVEEQLNTNDYYLYKYLDGMNKSDIGSKYHGKLVRLYAEYAREKLLPFLKSSDNYPIQDALDVCNARKFYPETVYLLGSKMGNTKEALDIILKRLGDVNAAISFCQEEDDKELWSDLISYSLDKPEFVSLLLKRIGNYADPSVLIRGIAPGCQIDDLKDSLAKMMRDFNLRLSVHEACKGITFGNYFDLHKKLVDGHNRGLCVSDDYVCGACHERVLVKDVSHSGGTIVYNCRHIFHMSCLSRESDVCVLCNPVKLE